MLALASGDAVSYNQAVEEMLRVTMKMINALIGAARAQHGTENCIKKISKTSHLCKDTSSGPDSVNVPF